MRQWKAQDAIGQLEAQPPQQPLPQATLAGVDHQLEDAVDQDQSQEAEAERQQHVRLCQVDAVAQAHGMAEHRLAEGQVEREEWLRRPRLVEALALDTFVDDLLRKVQREDRKSTRLNSVTNAHLVCR